MKNNKVKYKETEVLPKKSFGQNFLIDENILKKIVDAAELSPEDEVLEIGPGFGSLTKHILNQTSKLYASELDRDLAKFIRQEYPTVNLIEGDFLTVPLSSLASKHRLVILGNIPYSITTPILFKLIEERESVDRAILLIQDEVAKRLSAQPRTKDYGILAVQLQAFTSVDYLFKVGKHVFKPQPNVNSALIRLSFRHNNPLISTTLEKPFRTLVRRAFAMRRKTLENNLKHEYILSEIDFNFKRRAEELSVNEFLWLTENLATIPSMGISSNRS